MDKQKNKNHKRGIVKPLGNNKQKTDSTPKLNNGTIRTRKLNIKHKIYTKNTFVKK